MRTNWQSGPKQGSRAALASANWAKPQKGVDSQVGATHVAPPLVAGWSSLVARQAHNLKVAGSNPAPATNFFRGMLREQLFFCTKAALALHEWRSKSMLRVT